MDDLIKLNINLFNLLEELREELRGSLEFRFQLRQKQGNNGETLENGYLMPGNSDIYPYIGKDKKTNKKLFFNYNNNRTLINSKAYPNDNSLKTNLLYFFKNEIVYDNDGIESVRTQIGNKKFNNIHIEEISNDPFWAEIKAPKAQPKNEDTGDNKGEGVVKNSLPMNLILYGPPGTGKTYHTVNKALEILLSEQERNQIFGESDLEKVERETLENKFKELKDKEKRIVFTTFHQSMSYEDFIEGIKPITSEDGNVTYEVKDGIFKQLCKRANPPLIDNFDEAWEDLLNKLSNNNITIQNISGNGKFEIELCQNGTSVKDTNNNAKTFSHDQLYRVYKGLNGTPGGGFDNYRKAIINEMKSSCGLKDYKAFNEQSGENSTKKPYVLIIDEINRGNVANIFGELITLIEEDKRLTPGKTNIYTVELPYSNEEFGVPSNLYIIGTMNTADRSVEALDTALRRRFSFEEMMPKPELLENRIVNVDNHEYDLSKLLNIINKRLEVLKDREHQIGHSYFMKVVTVAQLTSVFIDKINPLLQEYFYGDYEKIQLVLGDGFVKGEKTSVTFANNKSFEGLPEQVYSIIDYNSENSDGFDLSYALKKLMNIDEKKDETTTITTSENV